jgi:hypothetical protein
MDKSKIVHQIRRLAIAADSFHQCVALLNHMASLSLKLDDDLYPPMIAGVVVTYAKNFNEADGLGPLPGFFTKFPAASLKTAHDTILDARNKLYAHRDGSIHTFRNETRELGQFPVMVRINDENSAFLFQPILIDIPAAKVGEIQELLAFQLKRLDEDLSEKLALTVDFEKGYKQGVEYQLGKDFP